MRWVVTFGLLTAVISFAGLGVAVPTFRDSGDSLDRIEITTTRRLSAWDRGYRLVLEGRCFSGPAPTELANKALVSARGMSLSGQENWDLQCNKTLVFGESNMRLWSGTLIGLSGLMVAGFGWLCRSFARTVDGPRGATAN